MTYLIALFAFLVGMALGSYLTVWRHKTLEQGNR